MVEQSVKQSVTVMWTHNMTSPVPIRTGWIELGQDLNLRLYELVNRWSHLKDQEPVPVIPNLSPQSQLGQVVD